MSRPKLVERPPVEDTRKWLIAKPDRLTSLIVRRWGGRGAGGRGRAGAPSAEAFQFHPGSIKTVTIAGVGTFGPGRVRN